MQALLPLHGVFMVFCLALLISAIKVAHGRKGGWFNKHKMLGVLGLFSGVIAFSFIFILKTVMHYPHFKSDHGEFGLVVLIALLIIIVLGVLGAKGKFVIKKMHIWGARLTVIVMIGVGVVGALEFLKMLQH